MAFSPDEFPEVAAALAIAEVNLTSTSDVLKSVVPTVENETLSAEHRAQAASIVARELRQVSGALADLCVALRESTRQDV